MARGYLKEIEYRQSDIADFIRRLMKVNKVSQKRLGEELDLTQARISQKLNDGSFTLEELLKTFKLLRADADMVGHLMCLGKE